MGFSQVSLEIKNVDIGAGTLDIYMTNTAGCSSCDDPLYNTQTLCESSGNYTAGGTWTFDANIDEATCELEATNGVYFVGGVGGFQFEIVDPAIYETTTSLENGIGYYTIIGASGGSAEAAGFLMTFGDKVFGFSMTGAIIPVGTDVLLTTLTLDFSTTSISICFGDDTGSAGKNTISDGSVPPGYVAANWGDCFCALDVDECGVCGGNGIPVGDCDCFENTLDECDVCGGDNSTCGDCAGVPNGNNVEDNCGTCDNDPSNDCDMDCNGTWGGSLENDECGVCGGPGLGAGSYYMDCWDGMEYCSTSDCPIDPDAVSYKIYRNGLGIAIAQVQGDPEYTDHNLGYNEQYCYTVTYVNGGVESHHSNQACAITEQMPIIEGCMSSYACNYDESVTVDDGSCWFVNTGCSCEAGQGAVLNNCGVCDTDSTNDCIQDCYGAWGGDAVEDECGVCGGDNSCLDCAGIPNGDSLLDNCGTCYDDPSNNCTPDCNDDWGGAAVEDDCGVCGGTGKIDLFGVCCTESCIITGCDLPDLTLYLTNTSMVFNSSKAIKEIKFTMEGSGIYSASGGEAAVAGFDWIVSPDSNWVRGINPSDSTLIPAGSCGNLFNIDYLNNPVSISVEIKDENNTIIDFSSYFDSGCSEESACNYNPYSIDDISGSCNYPEEEYLDCNGECINDFDEDGVCDELSLYDSLIPTTYTVNDIYPNPFNPVTNIEFGLPENAFVQIVVYDIKGRQIATLMNSFQFAGYYSLTWDASDSPSGVYFINMTSDGFKQTRQVVLMK